MLDSLFKPKAVALIGASTKELSIGNVIIKNLQRYEYKGPIYPINPKAPEVRGIKAYPTIFDVPGEVDVAHIVIPPQMVPQAVEDCGRKGVKNVIINTAGFKEMGAEGEALEKDFTERAKKYGLRVFGPNCQGIINSDPAINAYCDFTFTYPKPGHISIVAQSGGVGAIIMQNIDDLDVGMRFYASNGNACDISIPEILKYYGDDEQTRVILLYIESLDDPKKFMDVAYEVAAKKPILAMKAGRTKEGAKAAASHTGGLAGGITIDLIFKKTGILPFIDAAQMCQAAVAFASQPIPLGSRVGMITNTGGPAVIATDELCDSGLEMPPISEKAKAVLNETMLPAASINNPIDVLATAFAPQFRSALDVMMDEEHIDSIYIVFVTPPFVDCETVAKEFAEVNKLRKKPIVCNYITDKKQWPETTKILMDGGIPCYDFPGNAARALAALTNYNKIRNRNYGKQRTFFNIARQKAEEIIYNAKEAGREMLSASDVYEVLSAYGIPTAGWHIASTVDEAVDSAILIGYPVVVKADAESIIHKSDMGAVAINIKNESELKFAIENMKKKFAGVDNLRFFIQKYLPGGKEIIIGATAEKGLGHLIMFGMGGIYVEVLKDVVFNLSPVTNAEAKEMISSIKMAPLLEGVRGQAAVNRDKIIEIIERVSQLVTDIPSIQEMDLNPVMAFEDDVYVVDARIRV